MADLYFYKAFVNEVVDGDSLKVTFDLGLNVSLKHDVRLYGLDSPETFRPNSALEKQAGMLVKQYMKGLIEGKEVYIKTTKDSKYGDYLGEIYLQQTDEKSINATLLENNYVRPYNGEKKPLWLEEQLNLIISKLG